MSFRAVALSGVVPVLLLSACGEGRQPLWKSVQPKAAPAAETRYLPAPAVAEAVPGAGGVRLSGQAAPGARVMLGTPTGETLSAVADDKGRWSVAAPTPDAVALYGLFMLDGQRKVNAEGYLVLTPDGRAAELRSGGGARVLEPPSRRPRILAIDFDRDGGAVVSGVGAARADLGLRIDRNAGGNAMVSDQGRFSVVLVRPLPQGEHEFEVAGEGGEDRITVATRRPDPLGEAVFRATPVGGGWRIDWRTPGGGVQTTLLTGRRD